MVGHQGHDRTAHHQAHDDTHDTNVVFYGLASARAGLHAYAGEWLRPIHLLRNLPAKSFDSRFGGLRFCHPLNSRVSSGAKLQKQ